MRAIQDAVELYDSGQFQASFDLATLLTKTGNADAFVLLGWIYENGKISTPSMELALRNYEVAASIDSANGNYALGLFLKKRGELKPAFECFGRAAENGSLPGAYNAGHCCFFGIGTDVAKLRAFEFYELAAKGGHFFARAKLARRDYKSGNLLKKVRGIVILAYTMLHLAVVAFKNKHDERILGE